MTRKMINQIEQDYWEGKADPIDMAEIFDLAQRALEQEPTTGHWITKPHVYGVTYCSECDFELKIDNTNYCPNCGAKMAESEGDK